jgi:hypothetical protein
MKTHSGKKKLPGTPRDTPNARARLRRALIAQLDQILREGTGKDPLAVLFSRRGARKGGLARVAKLTKAQRRESARRAARARWDRRK